MSAPGGVCPTRAGRLGGGPLPPMSRYYSKAELENSPSRRLGLDTKKETLFRWAACDLIKECGQRLKIPQLTIATATVFCHRFYAVHPHDSGENEWKTVAPASLFLAGKVEETPKALRDVVCVAYLWCHRKEQEAATERLKDKVRVAALQAGGKCQPYGGRPLPASCASHTRLLARLCCL